MSSLASARPIPMLAPVIRTTFLWRNDFFLKLEIFSLSVLLTIYIYLCLRRDIEASSSKVLKFTKAQSVNFLIPADIFFSRLQRDVTCNRIIDCNTVINNSLLKSKKTIFFLRYCEPISSGFWFYTFVIESLLIAVVLRTIEVSFL